MARGKVGEVGLAGEDLVAEVEEALGEVVLAGEDLVAEVEEVLGEVGLAGEDLVAEVEEARGGVSTRGGGDDAAVGVLPGGLAAGTLVLDEGEGAGAQGPAAWGREGWQRVRASGLRVNERRR